MGPTLDDTLAALTNHKPSDDSIAKIERIRTAAKNYATVLHREAPSTPERTTALTQLRTSVMFAVQSVILDDHNSDKEVDVLSGGLRIATQPPMPWGTQPLPSQPYVFRNDATVPRVMQLTADEPADEPWDGDLSHLPYAAGDGYAKIMQAIVPQDTDEPNGANLL